MTYLIIEGTTIYHEGDERSRMHPGHGYPAYSETVDRVQYFEDYEAFTKEVSKKTIRGDKFNAFEARRYTIATEVSVKLSN